MKICTKKRFPQTQQNGQWPSVKAIIKHLKQIGSLKMEETELQYFKELLTAWLEELQHSAFSTVEGLLNIESFESFSADYLDRASFESDRSTAIARRCIECKTKQEALEKIMGV
jgi:hypothetical protein